MKFLLQVSTLLLIGYFGFSTMVHAQEAGDPCDMDIECGGPESGLVCAQDPSNPEEGRCQERGQLTPDQENFACFVSTSNTCSQSASIIESCPQDKKFATIAQCEQYKRDRDRQQNTTTSTRTSCATGQDCVSLINPLGSTDIKMLMGNTVKVVVGIIGTIAFVVFVYGGFQWLTSAGNSEKISKGMHAMLWAGIGIIVVFSSYAILTLIIDTLQSSP